MSNSSPTLAPAGILEMTSLFILLNRGNLAGVAEISEIWRSRFNGANVLFLVARYSFIAYAVLSLYEFHTNPSELIGLYGILILRTYAIYQKRGWILGILTFPFLLKLGIQTIANGTKYRYCNMTPLSFDAGIGKKCGESLPDTHLRLLKRLSLATQILSLVLDVLVFGLTTTKTIGHVIEMRKFGFRHSLGYYILRDGIMYFSAIVLYRIVYVLANVGRSRVRVLTEVIYVIPFVLVNRLVLNLRRVSHVSCANGRTLGTIGTIPEPVFAINSVLGNIGAPLRMGTEDDEIEEMDDEDEIEEMRL
ncbi:hypothetical protein BD410DRAFT_804270 [Rickenella mellea]|uniref:RTA1-domain-containing protein n=1 Tax=Rickenella mellea TaxID=50990 RepID=A0A4Y7Q3G1_9AGAM|nr:hypothetical protein BD410DRAFT_804270 [Rickenella mellea]